MRLWVWHFQGVATGQGKENQTGSEIHDHVQESIWISPVEFARIHGFSPFKFV